MIGTIKLYSKYKMCWSVRTERKSFNRQRSAENQLLIFSIKQKALMDVFMKLRDFKCRYMKIKISGGAELISCCCPGDGTRGRAGSSGSRRG